MPGNLVSGFKLPQARFTRSPLRKLAMLIGDRILRSMNPDIIHETYYYPRHIGPRSARRVLTIYDMIKAVDKRMVIGSIRLMKKTGGKSGTFTR